MEKVRLMTRAIGIDPGVTGAVASLSPEGKFWWVEDTPVAKLSTKGAKKDYLPAQMAAVLAPLSDAGDGWAPHVYIEQQQSMPKQGVSTTFKTGQGYGIWLGILGALHIPYTIVRPADWKKAMGIKAGSGKDAARIMAQQLHPDAVDRLQRKLDHGRADAILIATYGHRHLNA